MQVIWLYVDDLVGKGLEWLVIVELLFYFSASLIPQALPLSVLLSSIMTFGNLGESYELVAAKAAGISIWKMFTPMMFVMAFIAIFGFFVSNILIPEANLKRSSLLWDVRQQKPSLAVNAGVFTQDIPGITLRVGKKNSKTQEMEDILIYDQRANAQHSTVIYAKRGNMKTTDDKRFLIFTLYNGARYEEMERQRGYQSNFQHTTTAFSEERINFDMNSFKFNRTDENLFKHHYEMLNIIQLAHAADSLDSLAYNKFSNLKLLLRPFFFFNRVEYDSIKKSTAVAEIHSKDTSMLDLLSPLNQAAVANRAASNARTVKNMLEYAVNDDRELSRLRVRHRIEWHRKFILSVICFVMFFIGAPLGSIIRKGGFGMPIVISILFYICFHIISLSGEKAAKTMAWEPYLGMWISVFVLFPVGIFLTFQASSDSRIFDIRSWLDMIKSPFIKYFKSLVK